MMFLKRALSFVLETKTALKKKWYIILLTIVLRIVQLRFYYFYHSITKPLNFISKSDIYNI